MLTAMLLDTHAHLDYPEFQPDIDSVITRAREAGVTRILSIGTSIESSRRAVALAERYPGVVFAVVGVHPTCEFGDDPDITGALRDLARHPGVVAFGETGLDYHRLPGAELRRGSSQVNSALLADNADIMHAEIMDDAYKARQAMLFQQHLEIAAECGLNVVIHQRDAWEDTIELLAPHSGRVKGVFHCFGGSVEQMREVISMGHLVSFTGIVTFKNGANVREVAASVPSDSYMVETDCPYLAPVPHRGGRCEPAHTRLVAEAVALARDLPLAEIARQTTQNAEAFFRFKK